MNFTLTVINLVFGDALDILQQINVMELSHLSLLKTNNSKQKIVSNISRKN